MSDYNPYDYNGDGKVDGCDMEYYHMLREEEQKHRENSTYNGEGLSFGFIITWMLLSLVLALVIKVFILDLIIAFFLTGLTDLSKSPGLTKFIITCCCILIMYMIVN